MSGRRLIDDTAARYNACLQAMLPVFAVDSGASDNKQAWRDGLSWVFNHYDRFLQLRKGWGFGGFRRFKGLELA